MRSAPAAQFTLLPQREPTIFVATLVASSFVIASHWLGARLGWHTGWLAVAVAASSFVAVTLGRRRHAVHVHWDTQHWNLRRDQPSSRNDGSAVGDLVVVIDLGSAMVLRFSELDAAGQIRSRRRQWLVAQRHALRPQWQAFRRTVYSPRPMLARSDASAEEAAF